MKFLRINWTGDVWGGRAPLFWFCYNCQQGGIDDRLDICPICGNPR